MTPINIPIDNYLAQENLKFSSRLMRWEAEAALVLYYHLSSHEKGRHLILRFNYTKEDFAVKLSKIYKFELNRPRKTLPYQVVWPPRRCGC